MSKVKEVDIDAITPVAQDYLKAIWSATEWGDTPITSKALAARFGTSTANVSETMKRLASQNLVDYQPYRPVRLTPLGSRLAVAMVRRHRIIETFLVDTLGFRWEEIHDEAERLEHAASDALIGRLDALLGHPAFDPHGDPIPTVEGQIPSLAGAVRLDEASVGRHRVRRISDADPENLEAAAHLGIVPGAIIDICSVEGYLTLIVENGTRPIPASLAAATWTTPAGDEHSLTRT